MEKRDIHFILSFLGVRLPLISARLSLYEPLYGGWLLKEGVMSMRLSMSRLLFCS